MQEVGSEFFPSVAESTAALFYKNSIAQGTALKSSQGEKEPTVSCAMQ